MSFCTLAAYAFVFFLVIISAAFAAFVIYLRRIRYKYLHLPSPPLDSWLFGHLPSIKQKRQQGKALQEIYREWSLQYGNVFVVWFIHTPQVIVSGKESIKKVVLTLNLPKPQKLYNVLKKVYYKRLLGNGLVTECSTQVWLRKRMVLNPAFHRKYLVKFISDFNSICDKFIKKIGVCADENIAVNFADEFSRVTMEIITKVGFNRELNAVEDKNCPFLLSNYLVIKGVQEMLQDFFFWRFNVLTYPFQWTVMKAVKFVREYGKKIITDRIEDIKEGKQTIPNDILQHIIQLKTNNPSIDIEELVDHFVTFFLAGQETTSSHLAFTLHEIEKHTDVEQRIVQEVKSVLEGKPHVGYEDLSKLEYLGQTLKESLRLHPPIASVNRFTPNDIELDGHKIPAESIIEISALTALSAEKNWPNSKDFDPDRFASPNTFPSEIYFPFSIGPRSCIGKNLAQFESKVIMARLYQEFELNLVSPDEELSYEESVTLKPKGGVWCRVKRRL